MPQSFVLCELIKWYPGSFAALLLCNESNCALCIVFISILRFISVVFNTFATSSFPLLFLFIFCIIFVCDKRHVDGYWSRWAVWWKYLRSLWKWIGSRQYFSLIVMSLYQGFFAVTTSQYTYHLDWKALAFIVPKAFPFATDASSLTSYLYSGRLSFDFNLLVLPLASRFLNDRVAVISNSWENRLMGIFDFGKGHESFILKNTPCISCNRLSWPILAFLLCP